MKSFPCINVGSSDKWCQELYEKVKHDIPKELAKKYAYKGSGWFEIPLEENSPSYKYVMDIAKRDDEPVLISEITYYTKAELERIEYFQLHMLSSFELEGVDAADFGTQYANGCPNCGLGEKIVGEALVDRRLMRKYDLGRMLPDVYVSEAIKNLIIENGFTGVSFDHEIKDYKGREMGKYYVMSIDNILPPMSDSVWLRNEGTNRNFDKCGHQPIFLRSDHKYEREKLANAKDFNLTYEYLDALRLQDVIISARVKKIFKEHKIHVGYFPVALV